MMRSTIPASELLNKASTIGQYYGFIPLSVLTAEMRGKPKNKFEYVPQSGIEPDQVAETFISFLKQLKSTDRIPSPKQPLFVWHTNITAGRPAPKKAVIQFHALGSDRPIADAVVIRALLALARDLFHEEFRVRINSMGDKETRARYVRELNNFFRKRSSSLPNECAQISKNNIMEAVELVISHGLTDELPASIEHLSDASRKRFEDLLEYMEMTETPYELSKDLMSRGGIWCDSCFEIRSDVSEESHGRRIAWGSRYSDLIRQFFSIPSFTATGAIFEITSEGTALPAKLPSRLKYSFIHIGDEAKRLSIRLADEFRRARLPISQHIGVESLTEQLQIADKHNSPYLLIMGRKEALENTAILRNRATQEDTVVSIDGLVDRLRTFA